MDHHEELRTRLAAIRRRWYGAAVLRTVGRATATAALPLAAGALAARLIQPSGGVAVALAAVTLVLAATTIVLVVRRMGRRPDDCQVARFVEEQTAAVEVAAAACEADGLVSAVEILDTPGRHSGVFSDLIVAGAVRALRDVEPQAVVPPAVLRGATLKAAAGAAALVVAVALAAPSLLRVGGTLWLALFPGSVQITVLTGDGRVKAGDPFVIDVSIQVTGAALSGIVPQLKVSADGQERTVPMTRSVDGGTFVYGFESVDRSFKYAVTVGKVTSSTYSVTALVPPRVQRIDLQYEFPSFTGLPPRTETDGGDVYGPAGTKVRLIVRADKPIAAGALALSDGAPIPLRSTDDGGAADLLLAKDNTYRVTLKDRDGFESSGETEYFIRVMDDRPPDVRIVRPSADQGITPLEEVAIEARADDDYGIASMDLVFAVAGRPPQTVPFTRTSGTDVAKIGGRTIFAEELRVQPGDVITYYARARDVPRGKRSTETRSDIFFLEVKPFNEEFVSMESQASAAGAAGTQVDALISAQKEIINATWNLERRANAGRSAADMKAVSQAQAELKARVEQMLGGGRRGGRGGFMPQQIAQPLRQTRPPANNPIAAAIEAMGKAVEQLSAEKTADALPHEMAALQGLLQAQADIRRRQVGQSSSASGQGGTSRTDRDLSALFDRELQRQQRTNYETPRSATEQQQPQDRNSDAADRVRDLARRQAELARRQRELSQKPPPEEEARRQLARLQREQEELQRQLEALEREVRERRAQDAASGKSGQQSSQGSQSGSGNQRSAEQNARDMRRVADDMRTASGEMKRQNAGGAAASAEKAAEALREMEQQMRSGSPDARRNEAGELQLEAQQIAGEQRRIADEAARLEKDAQRGGRTSDAFRRLASEKDRLADRVADLQRSARQAANEKSGDDRFRAAARQLESERIAERMRESAQQVRQRSGNAEGGRGQAPSSQQAGADGDRQLARALESVAETLGGGADPGGRRLSEELDRTREMRERLDRLEQNVRDAEAKARAARGTTPRTGRQAGSNPPGEAEQQAQRAGEEYARELQRSRESLRRMGAGQPRGGEGGTPEQHEFSRSSPGNEAFKQDFSGWESLRKDVDQALEAYENAVAARHAKKLADDRLSAGGSERVPDRYQQRVSRYFESLAKGRK